MTRALNVGLGVVAGFIAFVLVAPVTRQGPIDRLTQIQQPSTTFLPRTHVALPSWMYDQFEGRRRSPSPALVTLHAPAASASPIVPLQVSTRLPGVRDFSIDVDLNHDGIFQGRGERAYAEGRFDQTGSATVRLHGLVTGRYEARVRFRHAGQEVLSAVQEFEVLPPREHLPVSFEPNVGQADPAVLFLGRARGHTVFITAEETVFVGRGGHVQRMRLVGASSWVRPVGEKKLPGIANYFIGNDPNKWRTDIATYQEVVTRDVYPGVGLVHHSRQGHFAYDLRVAAGTDPGLIVLDFLDADGLSLDDDGILVVQTAAGTSLRHSAPVMYQGEEGWREAVKGDWVLRGRRQAGFVIAGHDAARELVIDPLIFSTYYGGSNGSDGADAIAIDAGGSCYVTGNTSSSDFTITPGVVQPTYGVGVDAFVMKLNPAGTSVVYATYFGGNVFDRGFGIAADAAGNAYVTGYTAGGTFPTTAGVVQTAFGGGDDVFVTKLNPTGSSLVYSTFLGGSASDMANGITIDTAGNAYVTGQTGSANFPTTAGAFQTAAPGGTDAFITKLNPTATALVYSTYLGGSAGQDAAQAIAVDAAGNAYVAGESNSSNLPTTPGVFQPAIAGNFDAFVAKLNPAGIALVYCTFVGGTVADRSRDIAVDGAGNAYIAGDTSSSNYPTTPGAFQTVYGTNADAFVTKLNPAGGGLIYSTFLGGAGQEFGTGIAVDAAGNAYITGQTDSTNFPTVNPLQPAKGGLFDAFVSVVNPGGNVVFSTYLGGNDNDPSNGIAIDAAGAIVIAGATRSNNLPVLNPVQATMRGVNDLYITKLTPGLAPPPPPPPTGGGGGAGGGGSSSEGSYAGGGFFGFGGQIGAFRSPILHGPSLAADATTLRVLNVAHQQQNAVQADADSGFGPLGWSLTLSLAAGIFLVIRRVIA